MSLRTSNSFLCWLSIAVTLAAFGMTLTACTIGVSEVCLDRKRSEFECRGDAPIGAKWQRDGVGFCRNTAADDVVHQCYLDANEGDCGGEDWAQCCCQDPDDGDCCEMIDDDDSAF